MGCGILDSRWSPSLLAAILAASALASPAPAAAPAPMPGPDLAQAKSKRATSCTFSRANGYSLASVSQKDCATIVLSALAVPSGMILNLSDLEDHTAVIFEGATTFAYAEWTGPLVQIEGTGITISGASGATLDGNGAKYCLTLDSYDPWSPSGAGRDI